MSHIVRRLDYHDIPECLHIVRENWDRETAQKCEIELNAAFGDAVWKPVYYVAVRDKEIIGLTGYAPSWLNYGVYAIVRLAVTKEYQKRGVGHALMYACLDDLQAIASLVMLTTNVPDYYQKLGFEVCFTHGDESVMKLELNDV